MDLDIANYKNRHSLKSKVVRAIWNIVWLFLFRPTSRGVLNGWRIFLLRMFGAKIGDHCVVHPSCRVWQPWNLTMGHYVALSEQVDCYTVDKINIGSSAAISQGAYLCCASHDISSPIMELTYRPIIIGSQAWVAARAFIGPGVTVGDGAVVGACAVVTKNVAPWAVVAGNPAVFIKNRVIKSGTDGNEPIDLHSDSE